VDEISLKTISSAEAFVEKLLASNMLSGDILTEAHMAKTALAYELARANYPTDAVASIAGLESQLAGQLAEWVGESVSPSSRRWGARWERSVGASLTPLMERLGERALPPEQELIIAGRLRDFLVRHHEHLDPTVSLGTEAAYQGGRGDGRDGASSEATQVTASRVQQVLEGVRQYDGNKIVEIRQLMGGYSKETFIIHLKDGDGRDYRQVLRKDGPGLPTGTSVVNEYQVLNEVAALGLPVAPPAYLEPDAGKLGTAFMLVDFVVGQPAHLTVPADPDIRRSWAQSIADSLVTLHKQTLQAAGDLRRSLSHEIEEMRQRVADRERNAHPAIAFGLSWLQAHLSDLDGRPACRVHADVGFHNMLMIDDRLVALLDWEFSHISDPVEDLSYVKLFMDQLGQWPWFLEYYEQQSGLRYDAKAARYFTVWKEVRNAIACQGSLNSLLLPGVRNIALSVAGNLYIPKFEIGILDAIVDANTAGGEHHD